MAKKKKVNSTGKIIKHEIYGIIIVAMSLLMGISIYFTSSGAGIVGTGLKKFFLGIFGLGAYPFPLFFLMVGLVLIINRGKFQVRQRFWAICLLVFNILLMINVSYTYNDKNLKLLEQLIAALERGYQSRGGGILSELVDIPLLYVLGKTGIYIVLFCIALILILVATEISLGDMFESTRDRFRNQSGKRKKPQVFAEDDEENVDEVIVGPLTKKNPKQDAEKKSFEENIDKIDKKIKILDFLKSEEEKEQNTQKETKKTAPSENKNNSPENIVNEIDKNKNEKRDIEYIYPSLELLSENISKGNFQDKKELLSNAKILEETLQSFGVDAKVVQVSRGPSVTRYELHPSPGVKVSRIVNLSDDLALNLAAPSVRIEAPIPGKAAVGIEVPNKEVVAVKLREVLESDEFREFKSRVAFALGKDIGGKCIITDLSKMPHLLIAGATGSGKSVCINTLITSLIYKSSPSDVKMLLIDPKVVELSVYNGIPHLLVPVVTDPKKAASALYWAVNEMTQRYKLFADNNVRNIESYNKLMESKSPDQKLPQVVIIIDELADLMMVAANDVEDAICRLAQMARAAGMHLVIATQRPSVDVITGVIKANIPSRISFAVSSQIDSRTILDMSGAEKLLGKGDMLFMPIGENKPLRIQGAFISEKEVENVVSFLKNSASTNYSNEIIQEIESSTAHPVEVSDDEDELLPEAIKIGIDYGQVSASMLQRRLRIGFNRASRLVEEMESRGIVGPQEGSKPRQVLISKEEFEDDM